MTATATAAAPAKDRQKFYDKIAPMHLAPLWEALKGLVPPEPKSKFVPHLWRFDDCRALLMEAGELLTAEEAERRVLVFENPAMPGGSRITATMYSGMQLIMPGEIAAAHRHTASALRLVLEGNLGYTAVAGERTQMERGDFVITPNWAWHDHGQEQKKPVIWIDGLDLHIINFFETAFSGHSNDKTQIQARRMGDSQARWGSNMRPFNTPSPFGATTPIFNYKYKASREALMTIAASDKPDRASGPCAALRESDGRRLADAACRCVADAPAEGLRNRGDARDGRSDVDRHRRRSTDRGGRQVVHSGRGRRRRHAKLGVAQGARVEGRGDLHVLRSQRAGEAGDLSRRAAVGSGLLPRALSVMVGAGRPSTNVKQCACALSCVLAFEG